MSVTAYMLMTSVDQITTTRNGYIARVTSKTEKNMAIVLANNRFQKLAVDLTEVKVYTSAQV